MNRASVTTGLRVVLTAAILFAGAAFAGQLEDGVAAIRRGDYETAYRLFLPLAEQGNAVAQFDVGLLFSAGQGVAKDEAQAVAWYRKAAEQGLAPAQANLGLMYISGRGVAQDDANAVYWLRKAAEQGNAPAQNDLGTMYSLGRGVQKDDSRAYFWFLLASAQGHPTAIQNRNVFEKRLSPEQQANVQAAVQRLKPGGRASPGSTWSAPVAAESEMLRTTNAGFVIHPSSEKPTTIEYAMQFHLKRALEKPQLAIIKFENTEPGGPPIILEHIVGAGETEITVSSLPLPGIAPGRVYAVVLTLYSDSTKSTVVATHTQQVQSPDVPSEVLSKAGIKVYN